MNYFAGKWRLYETARVCRRPTISYGSWWNPPPKSTRLVPTVTETKKAQCFSATPVVSILWWHSHSPIMQCETECLYLFPVCWSSQKDCDHLLTLINKEIGLPLGQVTNLPMFYCNTCGKLKWLHSNFVLLSLAKEAPLEPDKIVSQF